jgi:hypothetical protein
MHDDEYTIIEDVVGPGEPGDVLETHSVPG